MRIVFMGAPAFATPTLLELIGQGHEIAAVYTRAPKPAGRRGLEITKTPVQLAAEQHGIPIFTPSTLRDESAQAQFREHVADVAVVVAYGLILPAAVLDAYPFGCLNLHASLLPRWRGAAPIQRAIMAGDRETGVCVMRMEEGLDTGPVALAERIVISPEDTAGDLAGRLGRLGADLIARTLPALERSGLNFLPQPGDGATYARKIDKVEAAVDWNADAESVRNHIHGLSPAPGAYSEIDLGRGNERVKMLRALCVAGHGRPGEVIDDFLSVACGKGAVQLVEAQRAGKNVMSGKDLGRFLQIPRGAQFIRSGEPRP
jgi:methionyl-tRNA formyltransferase